MNLAELDRTDTSRDGEGAERVGLGNGGLTLDARPQDFPGFAAKLRPLGGDSSMKILLVNDATTANNYGSCAVASSLRTHLCRRRDVMVQPIFSGQLRYSALEADVASDQRDWVRDVVAASDYVVINGESALHDGDAPEIEVLLESVRRHRKPYCVANATLRPSLIHGASLRDADFVTVRDDRSVEAAASMGVQAIRCADAALFARFEPWHPHDRSAGPPGALRESASAATDWHDDAPSIVGEAIRTALRSGAAFVPFCHPSACTDWPSIVRRFAAFRHVICARYHGALLAILAGTDLTLCPSRAGEIEQLAVELGLEACLHDRRNHADEAGRTSALARARARLLEMRETPALHPLHPLELERWAPESRSYGFGAAQQSRAQIMPNIAAPPEERARILVDCVRPMTLPLARKERRALQAALVAEPPAVLRVARHLADQEDASHLLPFFVAALADQGDNAGAFQAALELLQARAGERELQILFAGRSLLLGYPHAAAAFFDLADEQSELTGRTAAHAARAAARVGDHERRLALWKRGGEDEDPGPSALSEGADAASLAGRRDEALALARRALPRGGELEAWPHMRLGVLLASVGAFAEGHDVMAKALRGLDGTFDALVSRSRSAGDPVALYVPDVIGVGSAVLAAVILRWAEVPIERLMVNERLHAVFRRSFPELRCSPCISDGVDARVLSLFEAMAAICPDLPADVDGPLLRPDPALAAELAADYGARFGARRRFGIAWSSTNTRTGKRRNLGLDQLREIVAAHPDVVFVSLQANVRDADRVRRLIGKENLVVDLEVDPVAAVERQLAQIAALHGVVTIDCSAALFAGALGVPTQCLLTGEPTWQWPERRSFYSSVRVLESPDQVVV